MNQKTPWEKVYDYSVTEYKKSPGTVKGLGWNSVRSQQIRFEALLKGIKERDPKYSILDVGCGYGDIFQMINWTDKYYGIDINPEMIELAKKRFPQAEFRVGNFIDEEDVYDWVVASGAFNVNTGNNEDLLAESIKKMWNISNKGITFNILMKGAGVKDERAYFYDPGLVYQYCRKFTPHVICRGDYLPHDVTYYLYH